MGINKTILFLITFFSSSVFAGINIEHWTTENGARVYFVAAPELPIVDVQVVFDAGAARDGNLSGMALLTNGLLSEGAGDLNADQISERLDSLGAKFNNASERDMASVGMRSLSESAVLDSALNTLALIINKPTFPDDAFARERNRLLIGIEQRKQSPDSLADEAFYKGVYKTHPYATLPEGYKDSVNAIKVEDLKSFYNQYYVASNAVVAIVGALDRAGAERIANQLVKDLKRGIPAEKLPKVKALDAPEHINIDHPSAQTHILVGQPGMHRGDPDYFSLYVGNHILGGSGLVARISNEIREKRGLSYSSYSFFVPMREDGPYTIGLQTRNDQAEEALKVLRQTVNQFIQDGPSEEELQAAKKNITGGFPLRIASNKNIIGYIAMIGFYDLPLNYIDKFNDNVNAVTVDSIKSAFQRRVNMDKMITVMVGGESKT
jgi:zinc protease